MAIAAVDRETEATYIRRERDWLSRAIASGRDVAPRMLPVLPASIASGSAAGAGSRANDATIGTASGHNGHAAHE